MKLFNDFCVDENGVKCNNPSCWDMADTENGRVRVSFCKKESEAEEPPQKPVEETPQKEAKKAEEGK